MDSFLVVRELVVRPSQSADSGVLLFVYMENGQACLSPHRHQMFSGEVDSCKLAVVGATKAGFTSENINGPHVSEEGDPQSLFFGLLHFESAVFEAEKRRYFGE